MLTIKQITDNTDAVIRGLEKKHFKNAKETIEQVLETNNKRRNTQTILDKNLSEVNSLSKSIGMLMKEGKKDEAETAKNRVAELKEANKAMWWKKWAVWKPNFPKMRFHTGNWPRNTT